MCGRSLVVEPQPSKLMMRVRFPPPAPCFVKCSAHIAQSVEHFLGKEEVTGSNPVMSSSILMGLFQYFDGFANISMSLPIV